MLWCSHEGSRVLAAGFSVRGKAAKRVLIRGVGPSLSKFGVSNPLQRPKITLYSGQRAEAQNAGLSDSANKGAIAFAAAKVGAFELSDGNAGADAALLICLLPGLYTVQVSSLDAGSGVALVEVYPLP